MRKPDIKQGKEYAIKPRFAGNVNMVPGRRNFPRDCSRVVVVDLNHDGHEVDRWGTNRKITGILIKMIDSSSDTRFVNGEEYTLRDGREFIMPWDEFVPLREEHIAICQKRNEKKKLEKERRDRVAKKLETLGIQVVPSYSNTVLHISIDDVEKLLSSISALRT